MDITFKKSTQLLIAILLFLFLITTIVWLAIDLKSLRKTGALRATRPLYHRRQLSLKPMLQPGQIEGWMTFQYINFVFRLPTNYLNEKLNITDTAFPNITLDKYADTHKLNKTSFIESARQAVTAYLSGSKK